MSHIPQRRTLACVIRGIPSPRFGTRFICIAAGLLASLAVASDAPPKRPIPWSFAPISSPQVPQLRNASGVTNPTDAFVLDRLEKAGLSPAPRADRLTLLRRAYFDLIGLPPPPAEIESFAVDDSPDAYEKRINRLLDSPQYGERCGRHWLDVVRYANTGGFENDHTYPSAWKYRDYVMRSSKAREAVGLEIADSYPALQTCADDLAVIRSCYHDSFNHAPAQYMVSTGFARMGRPREETSD